MRWLIAISLAACGYPPLPGSTTDAKPGGGDGATTHCDVVPSYGTDNPAGGMAEFIPGSSSTPDEEAYLGPLNNDSPADYLEIDLFADTPPNFPNQIQPTTITLGDLDDMTCGGCVLIDANCVDCYNSDATFSSVYMASGGTLNITNTDNTLSGTLSNATFVHVTIASNGATTVVSDGCDSAITSATFSASVQQQ